MTVLLPAGLTGTAEVAASSANLGPGFDSMGLALGLYDQIVVETTDVGLIVEVSGEGAGQVPTGPEHLVVRAIHRGLEASGFRAAGLVVHCHNAIPHSRGLGSSAAAVVGGLAIANALVAQADSEPLGDDDLIQLSSEFEGHPDNVVPSLLGGLCMTAKAASHRWRVVRCEWSPEVKVVVAIPAIRLATSEARRVMPKLISVADAVINLGSLTLLLQGLRTGNGDLIADGMHDRIHEPYRWGLIQGGQQVRRAALEAGAWGCVISGAGPSLMALSCEAQAQAVSRAMVRAWESEGVASRSEVLPLQQTGSHWRAL